MEPEFSSNIGVAERSHGCLISGLAQIEYECVDYTNVYCILIRAILHARFHEHLRERGRVRAARVRALVQREPTLPTVGKNNKYK